MVIIDENNNKYSYKLNLNLANLINQKLCDGVTKKQIGDLLDKYPRLTSSGVEDPDSKNYLTNRMDLLNSEKAVGLCITWCNHNLHHYPEGLSSYDYKHIVERTYNTYISNGQFMAAILYLGIPFESKKPHIIIQQHTGDRWAKL